MKKFIFLLTLAAVLTFSFLSYANINERVEYLTTATEKLAAKKDLDLATLSEEILAADKEWLADLLLNCQYKEEPLDDAMPDYLQFPPCNNVVETAFEKGYYLTHFSLCHLFGGCESEKHTRPTPRIY